MKLWSNSNVPKNGGGFNPERRLLAAVLKRAVDDFVFGEGELQESAEEWLYASDEVDGENLGFAYVCEALDFHMEEMRKAIRRRYEAERKSKKANLN